MTRWHLEKPTDAPLVDRPRPCDVKGCGEPGERLMMARGRGEVAFCGMHFSAFEFWWAARIDGEAPRTAGGMLQCQVCFALVLPEPEWKRDPHMAWHRQQGHIDGGGS